MAHRSITRRLIASLLLTQLALTIGVVSLAGFATRRQLRRGFDSALFGRAMSVAALVRYSEDQKGKLEFDAVALPPPLDRERPDVFQIKLAETGEVLASSANLPAVPLASKDGEPHWTQKIDNQEYRIVELRNLPVLDKEGPETSTAKINVLYGSSTEEIRHRLLSMVMTSSLGALAILLLAMGSTLWAIQTGLAPVKQLAESAARVSPNTWKLESAEDARDTEELAQLVTTMDAMLESLETAFNVQRDFISNAAHELKTPIAVLKSTLQLSLQRPRESEEYRMQLESALEDVARLESLSHSLLRLARAERLHRLDRSSLPEVELAESCEHAIQRMQPLAQGKSVSLALQGTSSKRLRVEPEDLEIIWNNLLENAIRYSAAGKQVLVKIDDTEGAAEVRVIDKGSGIAEADIAKLFQRFYRSDDSRARETGGYGLGLAIVKAMVEAYGGTIRAESALGAGTTFTITFP